MQVAGRSQRRDANPGPQQKKTRKLDTTTRGRQLGREMEEEREDDLLKRERRRASFTL